MQSIFTNDHLSEVECRMYAAGVWALDLVYDTEPEEWDGGVVRPLQRVLFDGFACDVEFRLADTSIEVNSFSFVVNPLGYDAKWVVHGSFDGPNPLFVTAHAEGWGTLNDAGVSWSRLALPPTFLDLSTKGVDVFVPYAQQWGYRLRRLFLEIARLSAAACRPTKEEENV